MLSIKSLVFALLDETFIIPSLAKFKGTLHYFGLVAVPNTIVFTTC
jgi:hypothetical protein